VIDRHLTAENKATTTELLAKGFFGGDVDTVMRLIVDPYYQHNPGVGDGIKGLQAAMKTELARYDYKRVVRILGEGNFVVTISEIQYDGKPAANFDLFRLEKGKIIEHWDLYEHIAPAHEWKNANGKF
jgi:predicted SnoaL-like aldol condensation-catalyzing enzyme